MIRREVVDYGRSAQERIKVRGDEEIKEIRSFPGGGRPKGSRNQGKNLVANRF